MEADRNNDGVIDYDEFVAVMREQERRIDEDFDASEDEKSGEQAAGGEEPNRRIV